MSTLAVVCAALGLVFAGVAAFQAVIGVHMISSPWTVAFVVWGVAVLLYVLGKRAAPPDSET